MPGSRRRQRRERQRAKAAAALPVPAPVPVVPVLAPIPVPVVPELVGASVPLAKVKLIPLHFDRAGVLPTWSNWASQVYQALAQHLPRDLHRLVWDAVGESRENYLRTQAERSVDHALKQCEHCLMDFIDHAVASGELVISVKMPACTNSGCPCPSQLWHTHVVIRTQVVLNLQRRFPTWEISLMQHEPCWVGVNTLNP